MPTNRRESLTRRDFFKFTGAGIAALYLHADWSVAAPLSKKLVDWSPINRTLGDVAAREFSGDHPERVHPALWALPRQIASSEKKGPVESAELVIVGGGMSGLFSAYFSRAFHPIVLEQAPRFGGNAKGESWKGIDYSIGAAYLGKPQPGSEMDRVMRDIGANRICREKHEEDPVSLAGRWFAPFWSGVSDPAHVKQFAALKQYFLTSPSEIPANGPASLQRLRELDKVSLYDHLKAKLGETPSAHLDSLVEHYCWSSFGASSREISAAAGLNFLSGEFGKVWVAPGGNSAIAELLVDKLAKSLPSGHLRPSSLALQIRTEGKTVVVDYRDEKGNVRTIRAKAAVLACPKHVVAHIVPELGAERLAAIRRRRSRAYVVGNVLMRHSPKQHFHDLFFLAEKASLDVKAAAHEQGATDVILANFALGAPRSESVLTLYRALPYDDGRAELLDGGSYEKFRAQMQRQISSSVLPLLGLSASDIVDIRLSRWGHPMPVPFVGTLTSPDTPLLGEPLHERLFFVQQDNWCLPALETAFGEAAAFAPRLAALLKKS